MIGVGLVSYGRRDYRTAALAAIARHLPDVYLAVAVDVAPVAAAKNRVLTKMLRAGCDWLFVSEDDVIVVDPKAITGYLDACHASGLEHLSFHDHGPANRPHDRGRQCGPVTYWPNAVGAWSVYSRRSLELGGLFDEHFENAFEHVEHTQRLAQLGFTTPWPRNADATGSEGWLREIPDSIDHPAIPFAGRDDRMAAARAHWIDVHPETHRLVFGYPA